MRWTQLFDNPVIDTEPIAPTGKREGPPLDADSAPAFASHASPADGEARRAAPALVARAGDAPH